MHNYIKDTQKYIETVKKFREEKQNWISDRKTELDELRDIKKKVKEEDKKDSRRQDLKEDLGKVLMNTKEGLAKLHDFLDAVEKLAVTSLSVFVHGRLIGTEISVNSVISARIVSPLLLHFKRDPGQFYCPILNNLDTLEFQLNQYIVITQKICEILENGYEYQMSDEGPCDEYSDEHLDQLTNIRQDESFRLRFLFKNKAQDFINVFNVSKERMFSFLSDLEKAADQLDGIEHTSNVNTAATSVIGMLGGAFFIAGLVSTVVFTGIAAFAGIASGALTLSAYIKETIDNKRQGKKVKEVFSEFMKDVSEISHCIEVTANTIADIPGLNTEFSLEKMVFSARDLTTGIIDIAKAAEQFTRPVEGTENVDNAGHQEVNAGRRIPNMTSDIPDVGKLSEKKRSQAFTKTVIGMSIGINALFLGFDAYFLCTSLKRLFKGSKNEVAEHIRDRLVLWRSEVRAWHRIHNHLTSKGETEYQNDLQILAKRFNIVNTRICQ